MKSMRMSSGSSVGNKDRHAQASEEQENTGPYGRSSGYFDMDASEHSDSEFPALPGEQEDEQDQQSSSLHLSDAIDATNLQSDDALSIDEQEMRRHLSDVESSFLPEPASAGHGQQAIGADDTYVNIGDHGDTPPLRSLLGLPALSSSAASFVHATEDDVPPETPGKSQIFGKDHADNDHEETDTDTFHTSGMPTPESDPSSPAAAAAQRSHSRAPTQPNNPYDSFAAAGPKSVAETRGSSPESVVRRAPSLDPRELSLPPSESGTALSSDSLQRASSSKLLKRPSYLYSRQASQRSSASSQGGMSEFSADSDVTISADYALQTGGAIPRDSPLTSRPNQIMSRLPSLGSVASEMTRDDEGGMPAFNRGLSGMSAFGSMRRQLARLEEERGSSMSPPVTPRVPISQYAGITDTAIAQHVQNIHVPDTIAKEYRQQHRSISPDKRPLSSSAATVSGRPQSTLTLREQNSKIDKLTKENFDLKLKIHFLDQALQNRSDEGIKDMINKNVQYQTDLANERKENQSLRRKLREMEKRLRETEEELAEAHERANEAHLSSHEDMEIEISELRQQLDHCQVRITKLSAENLAKELEKRKMAEYVASMSEKKGSEQSAAEEEAEMWKDLLTTESSRREQAEEDVRKLREEMVIIRSEKAARDRSTKRSRGFAPSATGESENGESQNGAPSSSSVTMVEQLRHENVELRRDLGAQTSMLTSRNKERERLQQEIEDLKLMSRKSDGARSLAGDSILERSASRAHQRSMSRASVRTGMSQISETEREQYEQREGALRDQNASLRLEYQDLEKEADARMEYINQLEEDLKTLDGDLNIAVEDLKDLQKERDDALQALEGRDQEYERLANEYRKLEDEALLNIENLEQSLAFAEKQQRQLSSKLEHRNEDFSALQQELRGLGTNLVQLEDDREIHIRRVESLEQELEESTQELESLDRKVSETNQKNQRLEIQQESLHSEISFLREEQEADKVKIGDLENSLSAAQQNVQDEKEKMQELEASLNEERKQREIVDDQSKQEVQKIINDLNLENSKSKDEVRRLKRNFSTKDTEATTYKNRLEELESNLRRALGDLNGTRTSLLLDIEKLQLDLERTVQQLDDAKASLAEKDRTLRNRDMLLESTGLESRRLSDMLEKERQARKHDLHQFELSQRGHSSHARSSAQLESRVQELETARSQDRRKATALEQQYRDQLSERNNLLLALWNRLSTLCGVDWTKSHSLVNGENPGPESISRALPAFNRNIIDATRQIESLIGGFKSRIRNVEKGLQKDYQILEHNLEVRIKRMDYLERSVKEAQDAIDAQQAEAAQLRPTTSRGSSFRSVKGTEEMKKITQENKLLKAELKFHRDHPSPAARERMAQDAAVAAASANRRSSVATSIGGANKVSSSLSPRHLAHTLLRHHSTSAVEMFQHQAQQNGGDANGGASGPSSSRAPIVIATPPIQPSEQRWIHRLKELERRLKAEREARLLDRKGARQRLEEGKAENEELRLMLEREKERSVSVASGSTVGPMGERRREDSVD